MNSESERKQLNCGQKGFCALIIFHYSAGPLLQMAKINYLFIAYLTTFCFQQPAATEEHTATLLSSLCEMGFCDRQLNLRLLKKHNNNMVQVVTELLQISNSDWYSSSC